MAQNHQSSAVSTSIQKKKKKKNMELPLQCRHKTDKRPELFDQTFFIYIF